MQPAFNNVLAAKGTISPRASAVDHRILPHGHAISQYHFAPCMESD